ncbi:MAG: hypothetical protein GY822_15140 [Deltaproteobacteria bacterium]|nr:hypothetical protein [Deltaproteobacteria bacterium]
MDAPGEEVQAVQNDASLLPKGEPGSVSFDDLQTVCEGKALPTAAAYQKQVGVSSTIMFNERRFNSWGWPGRAPGQPQLPGWWYSFKEPANTQLVICVDATEKNRIDDCRYEGGGGSIAL